VSGVDTLKAGIKKLSAKAMQAKMDLHGLREELRMNWRNNLDVAQRAALKQLEAA
jgi:hypothetical protein